MRKSITFNRLAKSVAVSAIIFALYFILVNSHGIINKVVNKTTKINDYKIVTENLLGINSSKNILILFMNNSEARHGGGFIGTVGYANIDQGKVTPEPVRSVYYYDYKFAEVDYRETDSNNGSSVLYNLRDGGSNLDWPTNAKRAKNIFELESGKSVDIVIGLTPDILKYLITATGPIRLNDYNLTITADNITETLQQEVESGQDKVDRKDPKTVLTSVGNELIGRLSQKSVGELANLAGGIEDLLASRQILIYTGNYELSKSFTNLAYDGSMVGFGADYFLLSESNYSVDKSNAFIERKLERSIDISPDGSINISVKIIRTQTLAQSFEYVDPVNHGLTYLVKPNKSSIKFALPANSKLDTANASVAISSNGKEQGYDIYSFNSELAPLVPSEYSFSYHLPYKLTTSELIAYNSYIQIQNGGWPYQLHNVVKTPKDWQLNASNKNDLISTDAGVVYNKKVDRDLLMSLIYAKN